MSVASDGKDAGESDGSAHRHRVPPAVSAVAAVLPEPFTPAKPTIPAIPHQRRPDGPTAIATASIPDPATVGTLAGEARADAGDARNLEFIVTLPGTDSYPTVTNDPDLVAADSDAPAEPEDVETVEGELMEPGAPPTMAADDSPTVADVAPAFAIVAEEDPEDAEDYRGTRRRTGRWRRLPVGALAVAVLILLITGAVAIPLLRSGDSGGSHNNGLPGRVPGVDVSGLPEPAVAGAPTTDDSASDGSSPTAPASRTRSASAAASRGSSPSAAASTTSAAPKPPPPPAQPASGRLHGKQSGLCIEFRTTRNSVILILDNCDAQASNQHFRVQGDLNTGAALLTDGGWCVDVQNAGTGNGNAVWVFKCNNTPAQRWIRHPNNTWENPVSHRCLDAANGGTAPGTPLIIWDCKATDNQIWTMS